MRTRARTRGPPGPQRAFGDADLMVTLLTEARGEVSAVAMARRSAKRFPALEPMHLLRRGVRRAPGRGPRGPRRERHPAPAHRDRARSRSPRSRRHGAALGPVPRGPASSPGAGRCGVGDQRLLDRPRREHPGPPPSRALLAGAGPPLAGGDRLGSDLARCVRCGRACDKGSERVPRSGGGAGLICWASAAARAWCCAGAPRAPAGPRAWARASRWMPRT